MVNLAHSKNVSFLFMKNNQHFSALIRTGLFCVHAYTYLFGDEFKNFLISDVGDSSAIFLSKLKNSLLYFTIFLTFLRIL